MKKRHVCSTCCSFSTSISAGDLPSIMASTACAASASSSGISRPLLQSEVALRRKRSPVKVTSVATRVH